MASQIPRARGGEGGVVLCQALFQSIKEQEWMEMHEKLKDVTRKTGAKKAGQRIGAEDCWSRESGLEKTLKEGFFSAKEEQVEAFECLLSIWRVDITQVLPMCEHRQAEVDTSPRVLCVVGQTGRPVAKVNGKAVECFYETGTPVFSFFPRWFFNGTACIRASPSCWVDS